MSSPSLQIVADDLTSEEIVALLRFHADEMTRQSPPGACHFFDVEGLRRPEVSFWSMWHDDRLAGCGALVELSPTHGEIKSMRTVPEQLGRGVGRRMLEHIVDISRRRGYRRLSLETGSTDGFVPAIGLYESAGFVATGPFGDYVDNGFSRYFTMALDADPPESAASPGR